MLSVLVLVGFLGQFIAPYVWLHSERHHIASFLKGLPEDNLQAAGTRTWHFPKALNELELSFEAKLKGETGWQWFTSSGGFKFESLTEDGMKFTRVTTPTSNDPYLMRTFTLGEAVGGQTFRVDIDLRSNTPIAAEGCRGVWLQAWYEGGEVSCLPVALTPEWQTFSHIWTAPLGATSRVIRVILNDFNGLSYDVGNVHLYKQTEDTWLELSPLLPSMPALTTSWDASEKDSGQALKLSNEWQTFHLRITKTPPAEEFRATLLVPENTILTTRKVKLNVPAQPVIHNLRQSYFFSHPNLAGHTVVTLALVTLALSPSLFQQLILSALGLVACYFTGSRTAWLVLLGSLASILWFKQIRHRKLLILFYSGLALVLFFSWEYLGRLQITNTENPSSRPDIWLASLKMIADYPLGIGNSTQTFSSLWFQKQPSATEAVSHAHNIVLRWGVVFGLGGLLASLYLLVRLSHLGWWRQGRLGLIIMVAVIMLNMFDSSLFYSGVLCPLLLYLNAEAQQQGEQSIKGT